MTTIELNAFRNELAREILSLDDLEVLKSVRRTINRALKMQTSKQQTKEDLTPYTLSEIHSWIDESLQDITAGRVYTTNEIEVDDLKEMPWLTK